MKPFIDILHFHIHSASIIMLLTLFISALYLFSAVKNVSKIQVFLLLISSFIAGIVGGRLFHVIVEKPDFFMNNPEMIFSRFDGMTFFGSFFSILLVFYFFSKFFFKSNVDKKQFWDSAAVIAAGSYGLMRVGCFLNGCCWGTITTMPWSVQYFHPQSVMPARGIPVHPVQLYDAIGGLALMAIFLFLKNKKQFSGHLMKFFFILYPVVRFLTEEFRGDRFRGEDVVLGFSTSQAISIALFIFGAYSIIKNKFNLRPILNILPVLFLLTSCVLPKAPNKKIIKDIERIGQYKIEVNKVNQRHKIGSYRGRSRYSQYKTPNRNLLLIALDDTVQNTFKGQLSELYKTENAPRIEDITWWRLSKKVKGMYDHVVRIPHQDFHKESFIEAIKKMEELGKPYDLLLLTHGLPNNITTTSGRPFISYEDLEKDIAPLTKNLKMAFLQGCFSNTLEPDFFNMGAEAVLSFDEWNRNFFYIDFFFANLKKEKFNIQEAFEKTNRTIEDQMSGSKLYQLIIESLGMTFDEYFKNFPGPSLAF